MKISSAAIVLLLFSCKVINIFSHRQSKDQYIVWSENRRLSWHDYKGTPSNNSDESAISMIQLRYNYKLNKDDNKIKKFDIYCTFSKTSSWYKDTADYLLDHEQKHFDIGEIFARKCRKHLKEIIENDSLINESKLTKIINQYFSLESEMQDEYDLETDHSINIVKQEEWNKKIEAELTSLKAYQRN